MLMKYTKAFLLSEAEAFLAFCDLQCEIINTTLFLSDIYDEGAKNIMPVPPYQLASYCSNKMIFITGTCSPIAHPDVYVPMCIVVLQ